MARASDERARWLARHVLPHEAALRAWLLRRVVGDLEPDDIIQEAYAKLIALPGVEGIRDPRSYLFQVAKSVIATQMRGRKVVTLTIADVDMLDQAADEPSVEEQVADREELQRLMDAVAALPEPTRTIFRLRRIEQLPQREIANRLRMPESTVEKHISRAFAHMSVMFARGGKRRVLASRLRDGDTAGQDEAADGTRD